MQYLTSFLHAIVGATACKLVDAVAERIEDYRTQPRQPDHVDPSTYVPNPTPRIGF